jgi:hypothetical protein
MIRMEHLQANKEATEVEAKKKKQNKEASKD